GDVGRTARGSGRVRAGGAERRRRRRGRGRSGVDEGPVSRGARAREGAGQARVRQLHRVRLRELPLDEGQYVYAAGDRGGADGLRWEADRVGGEGRGGELLGDVVRAVPERDPELQQAAS